MTIEERIAAIEAFRGVQKFRCTEPEFSHLNPSPDSVIMQARTALNKCIDDVLQLLKEEKGSKEIGNKIKQSINWVDKSELDTEDREYVAFYFHSLGKISGVNISFAVNRWLYGLPLAFFISVGKKG